ncbi:TonB-dependent receptor, plug [Psychromonas sp. CNPT3]|uniref:TonB-dependent receptor plug domain-containing protein n=1 Tax=Psychromonas sp. CNPT3 TaxID=314282 RepID=UPI00006E9544|nr:TonB-dependent receptor [Psychromonas sp. CNPT3]AGH80269.1 TonB-dependent receptor, plug [Psychromonas sp. CNPT3]
MLNYRFASLAIFISSSLFSPLTLADEYRESDDVVISASLVETKRVESGSSITVLDEQYIKENQARSVAELLQDIPGVTVSRTGSIGARTSVSIRGAKSNQTLVIIDGVEVNDPTNINGGFNFNTLMASNIERIEVLKGAQSALWGSDAMGGVINITTKKGTSGFNPSLSIEGGSNQYHQESFNINGANKRSHYSFSGSNLQTDGISAQTETMGGNEDDAYKNQTLSIKGGHTFNDIFSLDGIVRYNNSKNDYDNGNNASTNSGYLLNTKQNLGKINAHLNLLDQKLKNTLSISHSQYYSKGSGRKSWDNYEYDGKKTKALLQSNYYFTPHSAYTQRLSFAGEYERDNYQSYGMSKPQKMNATGLVLEYSADWDKSVFFGLSARQDFNNHFENTQTYHGDISAWVNEGTRLHSSLGSGVKNPTFGQLSGLDGNISSGNSNLKPEKNTTWDMGVEYNFASRDAYVDITYFNARYQDMIDYSMPKSMYINIKNATSQGIELTGHLNLSDKLRINSAYTYNKTIDKDSNAPIIRHPKHTANINANYHYTDKLSANIGLRYIGKRLDIGDVELSSYSLLNLAVNYQINTHISVQGRIENALDKDYVELVGYDTEPLTAYLGFTLK